MKEADIVKDNNIDITKIAGLFAEYNNSFKKIVAAKYKRGELDFGLVGDMRKAIRDVEELTANDGSLKIDVLSLRRNEKDYLLRKDRKYIDKHTEIINDILSRYADNEMQQMLESYQKAL